MGDLNASRMAKQFSEYWMDKGYEKGETHRFWLELLSNVFGVENPTHYIEFEKQVSLQGHTSFIDAYIADTKVLIEQKGVNIDLRKPARQSDGQFLTPFEQAKRYDNSLAFSSKVRWIVVCNFKEFLIYDMEKPTADPDSIMLKDLAREYWRLDFLTNKNEHNTHKEMQLSIDAGRIVGELYDSLSKQYIDLSNEKSMQSLNILCVRLVFCLYAEDAGLFGSHNKFSKYLKSFAIKDVRGAVIQLFKVLNTQEDKRDKYLDDALLEFPYVNGGMFADEDVEIPQFNDEIVSVLVKNAGTDFDWSGISPTIFGAVFESTLNPETRRSGGMHYTSIENIHKVIDPLFLDDLRAELDEIAKIKIVKTRIQQLEKYRQKLADLKFLDPACGSGNFLTETYISIRRLENKALRLITGGQQTMLDATDVIKVSIEQFYGIEINDFAVTVAKTAMWIAESQMLKETEDVVSMELDFLPLKSYANIVEGNALRIDWEVVVPKTELDYIMGNPPFVGHQNRTKEQMSDMDYVFDNFGNYGKLDYVSAWYKKAVDYMKGTCIRAALVSTNSIVQGESVVVMWKPLLELYGLIIDFAYKTFIWDSETKTKAHVHCVIIGFSMLNNKKLKYIYENGEAQIATNINGYLLDAPNVFIKNRSVVLTDGLPKMCKGSQPTDGGNLFLTTQERNNLIKKYPHSEKFIKRFVGADEFINNGERYCLWLKGVEPSAYKHIPQIMERLDRVRQCRLNSPTASVKRDADTPMLFTQIRQPETEYLVVPQVSSERRKYIPLGYMSRDVICGNANMLIPDASLYLFGVMISNVHMAWMRVVCGRLKSDYRYTPAVYNNFPWCNPTDEQKAKIEQTAQAILDARALYPECSLADLYDEVTMPPELRRAHQENDRAVMQAYGFDIKTTTESSCVAELMKMYQKLI